MIERSSERDGGKEERRIFAAKTIPLFTFFISNVGGYCKFFPFPHQFHSNVALNLAIFVPFVRVWVEVASKKIIGEAKSFLQKKFSINFVWVWWNKIQIPRKYALLTRKSSFYVQFHSH
jgi:hypothetical protein